MFFNGLRESTEKEVELQETPVHAFRLLLQYIYTGKLQLKSIKIDLVLDILGLVHQYGFTELEKTVADYLQVITLFYFSYLTFLFQSICNVENVSSIFSVSQLYSMRELAEFCLDYIDNCGAEIIRQSNFCQLSSPALEQIICRDSFCAPEIEIFKALVRWMDVNPGESAQFDHLISFIRLSLIKLDDLLNVIRPSGLIQPDVLLDAINEQMKKKSSDFIHRGFLATSLNVASTANGASVICGSVQSPQVNGRTEDDVIFSHKINDNDQGIVIKLGKSYIINHIKMQLIDREQRSFCYHVDISMDNEDWVRVVDHTNYYCRNTQNLLFNKRVVRYIRICGTPDGFHNYFQINRLEAGFSTESIDIDQSTTLQIPKHNVATINQSAMVIEGVSRCRNALLNGDTNNYDWDNGYTCHQLGSGNITVQLPQPYLIDSIGLLLWDCDDREYSYYIEVSCDQTNWKKVVEEEKVASWRKVKFNLQPVVFIKIVGTYNSANEVFHCVHFECPVVTDKIERTVLDPSTQFARINDQQNINNEDQRNQGFDEYVNL